MVWVDLCNGSDIVSDSFEKCLPTNISGIVALHVDNQSMSDKKECE